MIYFLKKIEDFIKKYQKEFAQFWARKLLLFYHFCARQLLFDVKLRKLLLFHIYVGKFGKI